MDLKPVQKRTRAGHFVKPLLVFFPAAFYAVMALAPPPTHAQTQKAQPEQAVGEPSKAQPQPDMKDQADLKEKWGIEVVAIRLTAAGSFVDFRYRILDPEKAKPLMAKDAKAVLVDLASGKKFSVPTTSIGVSRSRGEPITGRNYFVLFTNSGGIVRHGSKVTVNIGDFKAEDLTVQ